VNKRARSRKSVIARLFLAKIVMTDGPESLPDPLDVVLTAR
jgi:hypothetical protein